MKRKRKGGREKERNKERERGKDMCEKVVGDSIKKVRVCVIDI
jgi:hypothetical protein